MEKISVIVPIYNVASYLERCIKSILAQTYSELDIILVDDGSTDGSEKICDQWGKEDGRIRVIHKKNGGVSSARNRGVQAVRGEYIAFVDPDDWIEPEMISELYNALKRENADISVCEYCKEGKGAVEQDEHYDSECILDSDAALRELIRDRKMRSFLWNKLFRKELFEGIVFPEGDTFEDVCVMHRLFLKADKLIVIPECLYHYDFREVSIVHNKLFINEIDSCRALMKRYDMLNQQYPQETVIILKHIYLQIFGNLILLGNKEERSKNRNKILEIRKFVLKKDHICKAWKQSTFKEKLYYVPGLLKIRIWLYHLHHGKKN